MKSSILSKRLKYFLVLAFCLGVSCSQSWGQKIIQLSAVAGTGISGFSGNGTASTTDYYFSDVTSIPDHAGNPYGRKPFLNLLFGVDGKLLFNKSVTGLTIQYEYLGGVVELERQISIGGASSIDGHYKKYIQYLSINPYQGIQWPMGTSKILFKLGVDLAIELEEGAKVKYKDTNNQEYSGTSIGSGFVENDLRITAGIAFTKNKWGFELNYKHGIHDFRDDNAEAFLRILQARLMYTLFEN